MKFTRTDTLLAEGKTKRVWRAFSSESADPLCILEAKTAITANNDDAMTQQMDTKPIAATRTASRVFELLRAAGIPVAFYEQISPTEFLAPHVTMIPLECVVRRYAVGSFTKRFPNLKPKNPKKPHRFHRLETGFYLKTSHGKLRTFAGAEIDLGLPAGDPDWDDPLIVDPNAEVWTLRHPKKPDWDETGATSQTVNRVMVLPKGVTIEKLEGFMRKVFLIIERAEAILGCKLIDFKLEFGITASGEIVLADVVDNDSWRLWDKDGNELSKELFRQRAAMEIVQQAYERVADLVERFRLPRQAIVYWRGSAGDPIPEVVKQLNVPGVTLVDIAVSAHKTTTGALRKLEEVLADYPDGGVIITAAGLSNGLGPVVASHTSWPVISTCPTVGTEPNDIWSSVRMPSSVPPMVVVEAGNAVLAALNILALTNPAAYAERQAKIEELDPTY